MSHHAPILRMLRLSVPRRYGYVHSPVRSKFIHNIYPISRQGLYGNRGPTKAGSHDIHMSASQVYHTNMYWNPDRVPGRTADLRHNPHVKSIEDSMYVPSPVPIIGNLARHRFRSTSRDPLRDPYSPFSHKDAGRQDLFRPDFTAKQQADAIKPAWFYSIHTAKIPIPLPLAKEQDPVAALLNRIFSQDVALQLRPCIQDWDHLSSLSLGDLKIAGVDDKIARNFINLLRHIRRTGKFPFWRDKRAALRKQWRATHNTVKLRGFDYQHRPLMQSEFELANVQSAFLQDMLRHQKNPT